MAKRRLPIGIQTFRKVREGDCYYVDKTAYLQRLLDEGTHYFLSRPRRFGKSLFLDTLKELFEGNEALFEGLAIHDRWDWSERHPVVRLDFAAGNFKEPGYLHKNLMAQLDGIEEQAGASSRYDTAPERLGHLIKALRERTGQPVAILIDEYDRPILDALEAPEIARANRDYLRGLYSVIKSSDAHIRFAFLTGVSKFSKVSLFSGLNNLKDITLDPCYSAVCGYTEADLDTVFAPELPGLDRDAIRDWYNGYWWLGEEKVYNPFDILLLFDRRKFDAWWFETGTPAFLVETLFDRRIRSLSIGEIVRVVHEQRHCGLRGLLRERVLFLLRGVGTRDHGGGQQQPRSPGHGGARGRAYLSVRVQGGGAFAGGIGDGAIAGEGLCGEVSRRRRADPSDRRGVQPGDAQRGGVRGGRRLRGSPVIRAPLANPMPAKQRQGDRLCH